MTEVLVAEKEDFRDYYKKVNHILQRSEWI